MRPLTPVTRARSTGISRDVPTPFAAAQPSGLPLHVGYGDTEVALKVRFLQEDDGRPQVSFYPAVVLPTSSVAPAMGSDSLPKVFLPLWAQKTNGSWTYFGGGGVWHNPGLGNLDYSFTGIAASHQISSGVSIGPGHTALVRTPRRIVGLDERIV